MIISRHFLRFLVVGSISLAGCKNQGKALSALQDQPRPISSVENAPTIAFCDLLHDPLPYDKKTVRTTAILFRNLENAYLYDTSCHVENRFVWIELDPAYVYTREDLKKSFEQIYCSKQPCPTGRARVTVVGVFDGPSSGPYGHLDDYDLRISIMRVEQVDPLVSGP